jgi:dienelactone hydrolase
MDELVSSARAHWAPRFTANGVPVGDFERVLGRIETWGEWCREWSVAAAAHEALGREAVAEGRTRSAGEHLATAAVLYHFAKFVFVADPAQLRAAHDAVQRCYREALPLVDPTARRVEIPFDGSVLHAIHRVPAGEGPHPTVVMFPGLDSVKEELRSTEELFLARGLATFTVDGPGQGESEFDLPIRPDWETVGTAIVDHLETQADVDPARIGVWGVSLGGYYAPRAASGEPRFAACVSLCGPYDFGAIWDGLPQLTRDTLVHRAGAADDDAGRRAALGLSLAGRTASITCPTLVVAGRKDRLIPWRDQARVAEEIAGAELLMLEEGNHGCANVLAEHRYRTADWMAQKLGQGEGTRVAR